LELNLNISEKWADLHIHTVKSDGTDTVEGIFIHAQREGLQAIAITDHDTVAAYAEAREMEKKYGVEYVPGVELSAMYDSKEVHIVGLYVDSENKHFQEMLAYFQKRRAERAEKIIKKLKEQGLRIEYEELYEITENMNNAGRLHIAKLLVKKNLALSIKDAFNKFLSEGRPAYVEKAKLTVKEAVDLIREAGGISVLAHPSILDRDELIEGWSAIGLDGVEAFHPDHSYEDMIRYLDIAGRYGLLVSGGSDCHGTAKDYTRIGKIKLPYAYFEKIKEAGRKRSGAKI
jgi:predicted metal-dependent phosphoesterase TrpH